MGNSSKNWGAIFASLLVPFAAMIVFALIGNTTISVICLGISIVTFLLARIVEMNCVDIWIIWICGVIATCLSIF